MAVYRQIQITFWQDEFVLSLTPEEKYFYIYLMTNSKTTQCGIYELPLRIAEVETGYNRETIEKLFKKFEKHNKIIRSTKTSEICIVNWLKYNASKSPKVLKCIHKELDNIKDKTLLKHIDTVCIHYTKSIQTDPQKEKEEEKEEEEKQEKEERKILYNKIKADFLKVNKTFDDYGKQGKAIYLLINKVNRLYEKDVGLKDISKRDFILNMIFTFIEIKKTGNKIYQHPILPTIIGSDNMFPRILEEMKNYKEKLENEKDLDDMIKEIYK